MSAARPNHQCRIDWCTGDYGYNTHVQITCLCGWYSDAWRPETNGLGDGKAAYVTHVLGA